MLCVVDASIFSRLPFTNVVKWDWRKHTWDGLMQRQETRKLRPFLWAYLLGVWMRRLCEAACASPITAGTVPLIIFSFPFLLPLLFLLATARPLGG